MNRRKRILWLLLICLIMLSACGKEDKKEATYAEIEKMAAEGVFNVKWSTTEGEYTAGTSYVINDEKTGGRLLVTAFHYLWPDNAEQALFFETASGTYYDNMFNVAVNTGLRPGELFALTRDDLDMKKKVIYVRKTLLYAKFEEETEKSFRFGPPKTKTSVREVPINSICEKYLFRQFTLKNMISRKFQRDDEFSDLLFVTKKTLRSMSRFSMTRSEGSSICGMR